MVILSHLQDSFILKNTRSGENVEHKWFGIKMLISINEFVITVNIRSLTCVKTSSQQF